MLKDIIESYLELGVSLKSIADRSDVHYTTLSKWLNGTRELNEKNSAQVEAALREIASELMKIWSD